VCLGWLNRTLTTNVGRSQELPERELLISWRVMIARQGSNIITFPHSASLLLYRCHPLFNRFPMYSRSAQQPLRLR